MHLKYKITILLIFVSQYIFANELGEKVFKEYCWGCHHETSVAFGPSFEQIANSRTIGEIQGHIIAPESMYKQLGHKESVMPSFKNSLSQEQLEAITNFVISFKSKEGL